MAFMKHVGKHGDRKVCVLYRQVPNEEHMCLVSLSRNSTRTLARCCAKSLRK
jgi:hypothetical protein